MKELRVSVDDDEGAALSLLLDRPEDVHVRAIVDGVVMRLAIAARADGFRPVTDAAWSTCEACDGTGQTPYMAGSYETCSECDGAGGREVEHVDEPDAIEWRSAGGARGKLVHAIKRRDNDTWPLETRALCGFRPKRYWSRTPARAWEKPCERCTHLSISNNEPKEQTR